MRIISVAAPGNGSGKTLTLSAILGAFPDRLSAVKFTTVFKDGVNCPRTEKACACRELHGRFTVVTDPVRLAMEDTDTGRLTRAGARSVLWCLSMAGAHREAWEHLRGDLLSDQDDIITEGNTIIPVIEPDLLLMVMSPRTPRPRWKPGTWELVRAADLVVINGHGASGEEIEALAAEVARERGGRRPAVEDVSRPLASWVESSVQEAVAALLAAPDRRAGAAP